MRSWKQTTDITYALTYIHPHTMEPNEKRLGIEKRSISFIPVTRVGWSRASPFSSIRHVSSPWQHVTWMEETLHPLDPQYTFISRGQRNIARGTRVRPSTAIMGTNWGTP